jgi:putative Holliday junction resolvase
MKALGVDYGEKRIGLAISDELGMIASPMATLKVHSLSDAVAKVHRIARSHNTDRIVVGLPLGSSGNETQQSIQTRYFVTALQSADGAAIDFWNESYSTQLANSSSSIYRTARKKKNLDSEAARVILQEYLDFQHEKQKKDALFPRYDELLLGNK